LLQILCLRHDGCHQGVDAVERIDHAQPHGGSLLAAVHQRQGESRSHRPVPRHLVCRVVAMPLATVCQIHCHFDPAHRQRIAAQDQRLAGLARRHGQVHPQVAMGEVVGLGSAVPLMAGARLLQRNGMRGGQNAATVPRGPIDPRGLRVAC
jgi:hypothetical protein